MLTGWCAHSNRAVAWLTQLAAANNAALANLGALSNAAFGSLAAQSNWAGATFQPPITNLTSGAGLSGSTNGYIVTVTTNGAVISTNFLSSTSAALAARQWVNSPR